MDANFALRPEQLEAVEWMKQREATSPHACGGILADNVGAGKTYAIAGLLKASPLWPVLILVPKSLIWQWIEVLNAAELDEDLDTILSATRKPSEDGGKKSFKTGNLVLATHGCLVTHPKELLERSWGRVIVDEAHCAKNPKSLTSRNLCKLHSHSKWAITATPVQNCKGDILAIAKGVGIVTEDADLVRDMFVLRRDAAPSKDADTALPKLTVETVRVALKGDMESEAYEEAKKLLLAVGGGVVPESNDDDDDDDEWMPGPVMGSGKGRMALLRCRQAATHPGLYYESMSRAKGTAASRSAELARKAHEAMSVPPVEASSKVAYVIRDVLSHLGQAAVVFCEWASEMKLVVDALRDAGAFAISYHGKLSIQDREDALFLFRRASSSRGKVLVAQIKCASAGLNLQCASRAYIMRPQWNPATERQAIGRLHRSGQTRDVVVTRLVGKGTVDEMALERQCSKLKCITQIMKDDEMERVMMGSTFTHTQKN